MLSVKHPYCVDQLWHKVHHRLRLTMIWEWYSLVYDLLPVLNWGLKYTKALKTLKLSLRDFSRGLLLQCLQRLYCCLRKPAIRTSPSYTLINDLPYLWCIERSTHHLLNFAWLLELPLPFLHLKNTFTLYYTFSHTLYTGFIWYICYMVFQGIFHLFPFSWFYIHAFHWR